MGERHSAGDRIPPSVTGWARLFVSDDPLVAAIDAVYSAAVAHGDDRDRFLAEAHLKLG